MPASRHIQDDDAPTKSITPQRKHRKLTKDGTGEVWPESIERIFVKGLEEYWKSPWATYSRGRSRWRNQFLVDYLERVGISRTKKQVASHIQVLRNMWKGSPEYHLVAGGEELFHENGLLARVKQEEMAQAGLSAPLDDHRATHQQQQQHSGSIVPPLDPNDLTFSPPFPMSSPSSSSQSSLSPSMRSDFLGSPHHSILTDLSSVHDPHSRPSSWAFPQSGAHSPVAFQQPAALHHQSPQMNPPPFIFNPTASPQQQHMVTRHHQQRSSPLQRASGVASGLRPAQFTSLTLFAEGMQPWPVAADTIPSSSSGPFLDGTPGQSSFTRVDIRIALYLPSPHNTSTSSTLSGFLGQVALLGSWASSARCITRVLSGDVCQAQELAVLQIGRDPDLGDGSGDAATAMGEIGISQALTAFLPDSPLSRCRWMMDDRRIPTTIIQFIVVDGLTIAQLTYDIRDADNRSSHSDLSLSHVGGNVSGTVPPPPPRAELISIQRQSASPDTAHVPLPAPHAAAAALGTGVGLGTTAGAASPASSSPSMSSSASPPPVSSSSLPVVSAHQPHSAIGMDIKPAGAGYAMPTSTGAIGGAAYLPAATAATAATYGQPLSTGVSHHQSHHAHHSQYPHHQSHQHHHKTLSGSSSGSLGAGGVYYSGDAATGTCANNNNNNNSTGAAVPVRGVPTERMIASGLLPPPNSNLNLSHSSSNSSSGSGLGLGLGLGNNSSTLSGALTPSLPYHHSSGGHRTTSSSKLASLYSNPASGHPMMFS